jgi:tRNA G18 (ribose-2'-O)-methylase SpoU
MRKLTHQELLDRQRNKAEQTRLPFMVALDDIRSGHNVGSIFRTADGAGVQKMWLCGITGYPPNPQVTKTALGAEQRVPWEHRREIIPVLERLRADGYQIVFLEQMDGAVDYRDFHPKGPVCLVIGNETGGISGDIVPLCDAAVEIEMEGIKNSLNVSVAFGIVAYHIHHDLKGEKIGGKNPFIGLK